MSDSKIEELSSAITYAASLGDTNLIGHLIKAFGAIENSDNPDATARAARVVATGALAVSASLNVSIIMGDIGREGIAMISGMEG